MGRAVLEGVLEHGGDEAGEQGAGHLQTRVGVHLNQPHLERLVDHEVQPEYLESEVFLLRVHLCVDCPD